MANDTVALNKAKEEDELLCVQALKSHNPGAPKYINVCQVLNDERLDMAFHIDVMTTRRYDDKLISTRAIDVKSSKTDTGNYCIGAECKKNVECQKDHIYDFAFRLWENGIETKKFFIVDAYDVVTKCDLEKQTGRKSVYYLVSIKNIREKCGGFIVESDIPD